MKRKAFSLFELIILIVILGTLASFVADSDMPKNVGKIVKEYEKEANVKQASTNDFSSKEKEYEIRISKMFNVQKDLRNTIKELNNRPCECPDKIISEPTPAISDPYGTGY